MKNNSLLHEIAITAIIVKNGKFLLTQRSKSKKRFPGKWTVPGGKLEVKDYINLPKDTEYYWYNVLEKVLRREVKEEVGIKINNIEYLTSLATVHSNGNPSLVISCTAKYVSGKVKLQNEETDNFTWATLKEASKLDLLDGIYDELIMVEKKLKGKKTEWKRNKQK
ncbi:MAG: NUDIX domain-containing protein [Patescibacteria group bacterium]